jgi:hypothetical protein
LKKALPLLLFFVTLVMIFFRPKYPEPYYEIPQLSTYENVSARSETNAQAKREVNEKLIALRAQQQIVNVFLFRSDALAKTESDPLVRQPIPAQARPVVSLAEQVKNANDALQKEIDSYEKYDDQILKREAAEKEGAKKYETYMPMVVSAFLGIVAVVLLFSKRDDAEAAKWVYGTFGAILGYWLKGGA